MRSKSDLLIPNELVNKARRYAMDAHGAQKYGAEFPYILHPTLVDGVLLRFNLYDPTLRCAAYLHDVLEDTNKTYDEIVLFFGVEIANIVAAVTEPKGGNRKQRHAATYPRIAQNEKAIIVKLADRIANVEAGGEKVGMYWKEHGDFKTALFPPKPGFYEIVTHIMWNYLDDLLISLKPEQKNGQGKVHESAQVLELG